MSEEFKPGDFIRIYDGAVANYAVVVSEEEYEQYGHHKPTLLKKDIIFYKSAFGYSHTYIEESDPTKIKIISKAEAIAGLERIIRNYQRDLEFISSQPEQPRESPVITEAKT